MCTMSMVGDHYNDMWRRKDWYPGSLNPIPFPQQQTLVIQPPEVTRAEFDELKRQVGEMVLLLKRAKKYDEDNGEPDCEIDEKMDLLRKVAKMVGVDLDAALKPPAP